MGDLRRQTGSADGLALWILFSSWCVISGWTLSLLGELNVPGVVVSFLLFAAMLVALRRPFGLIVPARNWNPLRSTRLLPKVWLVITVLAFLGGVVHAPDNFDYLTYRFPRLLHWWWEQRWHWIDTVNERMNLSGTTFEWLMAPFFILFRTDRLFFLINFVSYLFLPRLVYSVFTALGISRRISWWWMWVLPCGYCYILQAASAGNDSISAVWFLASLHYLFQAGKPAPMRNLALSCLALALMTSTKASNLPLILPWLMAAWFQRISPLNTIRPGILALIVTVSTVVSFVPTALLNKHYTHDFFGDPANHAQLKAGTPLGGVIGNAIQITDDDLAPPLWPKEIDWQPPAGLKTMLARDFPRFHATIREMQIEESAGVGLGLILCVVLFIGLGVWARVTHQNLIARRKASGLWIASAATVALLVYMAQLASEATSRLIAAYYPLVIALVIAAVSLEGSVVRRRLFSIFALVAMFSAAVLVILSPARPLFPVEFTSGLVHRCAPPWLAQRFDSVYMVYAVRADAFHDFRALLPTGERVIGLLQNGDDPEVSLWRPYGSHAMMEVTPAISRDGLVSRGIRYVAVSEVELKDPYGMTISDLAQKWSARIVGQEKITLKVHNGPETWYVLDLGPA